MPVFRFGLCRLGAQAALISSPFFANFGPGSEAVTVHWRMGVLLGTSILYAFPVDGGSLIRLLLMVAHCSPVPHPFWTRSPGSSWFRRSLLDVAP